MSGDQDRTFLPTAGRLREWLDEVRARTVFEVEPLPVEESREWVYSSRGADHRSGAFFRVRACVDANGRGQPLLEQREIGLLGNVVSSWRGRRWVLLLAKPEPGTVDRVQLTCTVQATRSNRRRRHGGRRPRFEELFRPDRLRVLHHSLETEQGSRFLGKWNANWTVEADDPRSLGELGVDHRWVDLEVVSQELPGTCLFTTDLRSVLATCPWQALFPRLAEEDTPLARSLREPSLRGEELRGFGRALTKWRPPRIVPLHALRGWRLDRFGFRAEAEGAGYDVLHYRVHIGGRENEAWDQPLVRSRGQGTVLLLVRVRRGALELALQARDELGLVRRMQLSTPYLVEPGAPPGAAAALEPVRRVSALLTECLQSEEGGRFYQELNRYEIRALNQGAEGPPGARWLRLADVQRLRGVLDNETRSAISLLPALRSWQGGAREGSPPAGGSPCRA